MIKQNPSRQENSLKNKDTKTKDKKENFNRFKKEFNYVKKFGKTGVPYFCEFFADEKSSLLFPD